jgi:diaminohydroxyphosphoribosylaminopyrimidine deaminase/5-amino-6-(5-phosphoribosylamino)uracil reductase
VQNGHIIAQACHLGAGSPHAEQLLLAQIPPKIPGISLYITLEPCNHWGKTPPCINAIIAYGVEEVIFSYLDPNPLVAQNNSSAQLREHGIKVTHVPLTEINEFYKSYAYWTVTRKPRVTVKMAQTLDGKIGQSEGDRLILSNSLCAQFTHEKRASADILFTTARTIQSDNPKMNVRLNNTEQSKPVAILDRHLSLNMDALIFSTAKHCHIYHHDIKDAPYANSSFHLMPLKNDIMDLTAIINHLGMLGYHDVWVEAGGALFNSLHQEGLVHRTYLYIVPNSLGQKGISAYKQSGLFDRAHSVSWQAMGDNMIVCLDWQEDKCLQD